AAGGGAARSLWLCAALTEQVEELVAGNAAQPTAKCVARAIAFEFSQARYDRLKYLLHHVVGIGANDALMMAPRSHQRSVQVQKASPSILLPRVEAFQKGQGRRLTGAHTAAPDFLRARARPTEKKLLHSTDLIL